MNASLLRNWLAVMVMILLTAGSFPAHRPAEEITIAAVGDIMLGTTFPDAGWLPPDDGATLLAEVAPILRAADLTFGNLEGPLIDGGTTTKCPPSARNCFAFRTPTRYGRYLKEAGFDVMSLANNHVMDFGVAGRESTKRVLESLGIAHSGEVGDIARLTVKGKKIELIAFATNRTSYNLNDLSAARQVVAASAANADIVIVSFHGGAEGATRQRVPHGTEMFFGENRGNLRAFARTVIDAGADLLLGHGPHVVRGMEVYKGRLIAYSLGNFATYRAFNLAGPLGLSLILQVRLAADGTFLGGKVIPIKQEKPGGPRLDPANTIIPILQRLSQQDFGDNAVELSDDGTLAPPRRR
ncbi:MAG: CapA family protein [Acidobacteriota bacterium]|nr:CapA family protein [Blastocatellia bacterium]MDW8238875.1 CapA family protein [Acidobacteriota bacterium]